ncbi:MAG: hypothetical protein LBU60_04055 [Clostridiales bacterium]|jgi:hypothetical protein|nr:hypothetical protein [Clostridiales bacterium]
METQLILINVITAISAIAMLSIGYRAGLAKSFKLISTSLIGTAIIIYLSFILGGVLRKIDFIESNLQDFNGYISERWNFLSYIKAGFLLYYLAIFCCLIIARIILTSSIASKDNSDIFFVRFVSKTLGAILFLAFFVGLVLIFFAIVRHFDSSQFYTDVTKAIDGSFLKWLFDKNPIII